MHIRAHQLELLLAPLLARRKEANTLLDLGAQSARLVWACVTGDARTEPKSAAASGGQREAHGGLQDPNVVHTGLSVSGMQ